VRARIPAVALLVVLTAATASAGTIHEITAKSGGDVVTYRVKFGDAKAIHHWTAFDPAGKRFVYMTWKRDQPEPAPAATIWNHRTGETVKLYKFPGVETPLPVIPSIAEMKVCPVTGDKAFTSKRVGNYD
jgi:hypothetical protein